MVAEQGGGGGTGERLLMSHFDVLLPLANQGIRATSTIEHGAPPVIWRPRMSHLKNPPPLPCGIGVPGPEVLNSVGSPGSAGDWTLDGSVTVIGRLLEGNGYKTFAPPPPPQIPIFLRHCSPQKQSSHTTDRLPRGKLQTICKVAVHLVTRPLRCWAPFAVCVDL